MHELPDKLKKKLKQREKEDALRRLTISSGVIDFVSNDYLGLAKSETFYREVNALAEEYSNQQSGATGSRLLSGNLHFHEKAEAFIASFHGTEAALIFNSGYSANIGLLSSLPQRGDLVLYDEYAHASIRDGISMGLARSHKFRHNDLKDLENLILRFRAKAKSDSAVIYVITESVFSMDGDSPDLGGLVDLCELQNCHLIVDEAHAFGIFGRSGQGLVEEFNLGHRVFARIVTFGKALGGHGAAVLCSEELKQYLINFARSFIYTTALPPHAVASILSGYKVLETDLGHNLRKLLNSRIAYFKKTLEELCLKDYFIVSNSAVQSCLIPANKRVKSIASYLNRENFDVRPILSPTVPKNKERLRFCIHAYNSEKEIFQVLDLLAKRLHKK